MAEATQMREDLQSIAWLLKKKTNQVEDTTKKRIWEVTKGVEMADQNRDETKCWAAVASMAKTCFAIHCQTLVVIYPQAQEQEAC